MPKRRSQNSTEKLKSRVRGLNTEVNVGKNIVGRSKTVVKRSLAEDARRRGANSTTRMFGRSAGGRAGGAGFQHRLHTGFDI